MDIYENINLHINKYGAFGQRPASESDPDKMDFDSDNPHLWSGMLAVLMYAREMEVPNFLNYASNCQIAPGLHTRQAPAKEYLASDKWDAISHDEHLGILMYCLVAQASYALRNDPRAFFIPSSIIRRAREKGWAFLEKEPNEKAWPSTLRGWINLFKGIFDVLKFAIKNKDYKGSAAMDKVIFKYPELERITRIRLPRDRYIMKRLCANRPGFLDTLHFVINCLIQLKKRTPSGINRLAFILLTLRIFKSETWFESLIIDKAHVVLEENYGPDYFVKMVGLHIGYPNNPLFEAAKGVTLNFGR